MRSFLLAAASTAALALSLAAPAEAATRALVIGINKFPKITLSGKPSARDLKGAVADAETMRSILVGSLGVPEADVKLLTDEAATRDGILAAFKEWLIDGTKPGDTAYFYFAGHGAQTEDKDGDEPDGTDEVLAPSDTVGELGPKGTGLTGTISDDELRDLVAQLSGREVVVIADACHSGTITRDALAVRVDEPSGPDGYMPVRTLTPYGPLTMPSSAMEDVKTRGLMRIESRLIAVEPDPVPADAPPPKVVTWTAVDSGQFAMEDMASGGKQGLFTSRFKKGVSEFEADLDNNGKVTGSELLAYLRKESSAYCAKFPCPTGATPTLDAYAGYDAATVAVKPADYKAPPPPPAYAPPPPAAYPVGPTVAAYVPPPVAYEPPKPPKYEPPPADYLAKHPDYVAPPKDVYVAPDYAPPIVVAKDTVPAPIGPSYYGEVTVTLEPGAWVKVGDVIRIVVKSDVPGRLILLDARDDGTVVQLFPNKFSQEFGTSDTIKAGETRLMPGKNEPFPFEFRADKADKGTIVALVVDDKIPVKGLVDKYLDLAPIPSIDVYAAELSHELNKAVGKPVGSEEALNTQAFPVPYGRGEIRYEIY